MQRKFNLPDCGSHNVHESVEPNFDLVFSMNVFVELDDLAVLGNHRVGQVGHLLVVVDPKFELGHRVEKFCQMFGNFQRLVAVRKDVQKIVR